MAKDYLSPDIFEDNELLDESKVEEPPFYKVLLHNDDYTTMDFVVRVLMEIFHKDEQEAVNIMLNVHHNGIGVAGVYTKEIAETKVHLTISLARENGFPLLASMEKDEK